MPPVSEQVDAKELAAIQQQAMETELDDDLGEHASYVDKLEAEEAAAEEDSGTDTEAELESEDDEPSEEEDTDEEVEEEDDETESESEDGEDDSDDAEEEGEDAEDEEPDAEDEPTADDALAKPDENPTVPRERLNAANRKRQEEADRADRLEQQLAQLQSQMETTAEKAGVTNLDQGKLKEAAEKALDGDTEAFATLLAEQVNAVTENLTKSQQDIREAAKQDALAEFRQEQAKTAREAEASKWEEIYPELDPENDNANAEALDEAITLIGMFESKGYSPAVAMERAVKSVVANFGLKKAVTEETEDVTPEPKPAPKKKVIKRAKKKPVKQPAGVGQGTGVDSETRKYDPAKMSQDEWDALPASVRDQILDI